MATRIFLGLNMLVWLPYGLFLFFRPGYLAGAAGVAAETATGTIELQAMYGGLQAGIGLLCLSGALRPRLERPALLALLFLAAGLGSARLVGAVTSGNFSSYTIAALGFEWLVVLAAGFLLGRRLPAVA